MKKSETALVIGLLTGDGHIQNKEHRRIVSFYSKNKTIINFVEQLILKNFQIKKTKIYVDIRDNHKRYKLFYCNSYLTKYLISLECPFGNKTNVKFSIPSWIRENRSFTKKYLQGLFEAEGSIYTTRGKKKRTRIALEMYKNKELLKKGFAFFNQIKASLQLFQIRSSPVRLKKGNVRKDGSESIGFVLEIEQKHFRKFYKEINFISKRKRELLEKSLAIAGVNLKKEP